MTWLPPPLFLCDRLFVRMGWDCPPGLDGFLSSAGANAGICTRSGSPHWRNRLILLLLLLVLTVPRHALCQSAPTKRTRPVQISSANTLARNGKAWLRMSDFPDADVDGNELGHDHFESVQCNPSATHAVVVGAGANHQWIAMVELASGRILKIKRLTEAGVTNILWDPRGKTAAVSVVFGSGKEGIVLLSTDGRFLNVGSIDAGSRMDFLNNPRWSADGVRLRATGRRFDEAAPHEVEFDGVSKKIHRAGSTPQ
jgi:hypothetical protein